MIIPEGPQERALFVWQGAKGVQLYGPGVQVIALKSRGRPKNLLKKIYCRECGSLGTTGSNELMPR